MLRWAGWRVWRSGWLRGMGLNSTGRLQESIDYFPFGSCGDAFNGQEA